MEQLVQTIQTGVISVLTILIGLAFTSLRDYLVAKTRATKASMKAEEFNTIVSVADTGVRFIEQTFKDVQGEIKLNAALDFVLTELQKLNIKVTRTELTPIVESAVHGLQDTYASVLDEMTDKEIEQEVIIEDDEHEVVIEE